MIYTMEGCQKCLDTINAGCLWHKIILHRNTSNCAIEHIHTPETLKL